MTQFIIKPNEDQNFYVMMKDDAPIAWGNKRDFIRWSKRPRYAHFLAVGKDINERLARADATSTDNKILKFSWKENTAIGWRGIGTVLRSDLKPICELLDAGVSPDNAFILTFVELFPETEVLTPEENAMSELTDILEINGIAVDDSKAVDVTLDGKKVGEATINKDLTVHTHITDEEAIAIIKRGGVPGISYSIGFDALAEEALRQNRKETKEDD